MKVFIGEYKIYDGEHQHYKQLLVKAENQEKANEIFESQEHDCETPEEDDFDKMTWWDYGDGMTIAEFRGSEEIPEAEADILVKHGVTHFFTDFKENVK
jgi:hypothetical protein